MSIQLLIVPQDVMVVVIALLFILQKCVQTQDGKPAHGLVKDEFQAAMKWLFVPLIQKNVQDRAAKNKATFSGKSMHEVIQEWKLKFRSCFELLKKGTWQSDVLNQTRKPAMKASQELDAAQALADQAKATRDALVSERASKGSQALKAHAHWERYRYSGHMHSELVSHLECLALQASQDAQAAAWAAIEAARDAELQHIQAQAAADAAKARNEKLQREYAKALEAFEPSLIPFFLMADNCPSYSPFADQKQKVVLPICPMLQVRISQPQARFYCRCGPEMSCCVVLQLLAIPPRAHDINQGVEHANGCAKGHTAKALSNMESSVRDISDAEVQRIVIEGAEKYTEDSWWPIPRDWCNA